MRGTLFGLLTIGVCAAALPMVFEFESSDVDSTGADIEALFGAFAGDLMVLSFLVAAAALLVVYFTDSV
jgi:hypothetical protein